MNNNEDILKPKESVNIEPVIYDSWEEFWDSLLSDKFGLQVPINFLWSGDKELGIELMSVMIANMENRKIEESLIKGVSLEKFDYYTNLYKEYLYKHFDQSLVKKREDLKHHYE